MRLPHVLVYCTSKAILRLASLKVAAIGTVAAMRYGSLDVADVLKGSDYKLSEGERQASQQQAETVREGRRDYPVGGNYSFAKVYVHLPGSQARKPGRNPCGIPVDLLY
jgi:hypothetical protein